MITCKDNDLGHVYVFPFLVGRETNDMDTVIKLTRHNPYAKIYSPADGEIECKFFNFYDSMHIDDIHLLGKAIHHISISCIEWFD